MKTLPLDNDWEYDYTVTRKIAATGATEAATGLTGLTGRISATDGGATINAALTVDLTERGTLGKYYGVVEGDDLREQLAAYIGKPVWEVFGDGTNVLTSVPRIVRATRRL